MRSFGSHLVMLLAGLAAGVALAVLGFAPQVRTEVPSAQTRREARAPFDRHRDARATDRVDAPTEATASPAEPAAERTPLAPERRDPTAAPASSLGEVRGRLHRAAADAAIPFGVVIARVREYETADPDAIARTADFIHPIRFGAQRTVTIEGDRFGFFDLEAGAYWCVVTLAGRRIADRPVEVRAGEAVELEVDVPALAPELGLRVHVTDERGAPLDAVVFSVATDVETALGSTRQETPVYPRRLGDGRYRLLLPWLAANLRVGRLPGRCTLKAVHALFSSAEIPLGESLRDEIEIVLARSGDAGRHPVLVHVERSDGGRRADYAGVQMFGPMETPEHPEPHMAGWWSDFDASGDARFDALSPGPYRCFVYMRASDGEARVMVLEKDAEVGPDHPRLDVKLPALHRVAVVAPANLAAIRPVLLGPGSGERPSVEYGDGSSETIFPLVSAGPHDVCFGSLRMRIEVSNDVRVDFVAER